MAKFNVGDRVLIKGMVAGGHTGQIIRITRPKISFKLQKLYHVQLEGTLSLGHSIIKVSRMNLSPPDTLDPQDSEA